MGKLTHKYLKENGFVEVGHEKEGKLYVCKTDSDTGFVFMTVQGENMVDCSPTIYTDEWIDKLLEASKVKEGEKVKFMDGNQLFILERKGGSVLYYKFTPFWSNGDPLSMNSISITRVHGLVLAKKKLNQKKKIG